MKEQTAVFVRAKIIEQYLQGKSIRQIASAVGCSKNMALKWVQIYKQEKEDETKKTNNRISKNEKGEFEREKEEEKKEKKKIKNEEVTSIYLGRGRKKMMKRTKIRYDVQKYIFKQFANKRTGGADKRSLRNVMAKVNRKFKLKGKEKITFGAIQRFTICKFNKPRKILKRPLLTLNHVQKRNEFADYILNEKVDFNNIFFTDEKRFLLNFVPNKQTFQVRLTKENQRKLMQGNEEVQKLLTFEVEKHPKGIMVAGGVSSAGIGKLNFIVGTMDSCAYKQTLINYQNDINYLNEKYDKDLIFQQDNAPCHTSKETEKVLKNMKRLKFWPPNSPDLSPIESVWSLIQERIQGREFSNLEELEKKILYEWNRIPQKYCKKLFDKFINDITSLYKAGKIISNNDKHDNSRNTFKKFGEYPENIENIFFNKNFVKKIIKKKIKFFEKKNRRVSNYIRKLGIKTFKAKCCDELNIYFFNKSYEGVIKDQNKLKKIYEKNIESLKKTTVEDYFKKLTQEKKQKLISVDNPNINLDEISEETRGDEDEKIIENAIEKVEKKIENDKEEILKYLKKHNKK